MLKMNFGCIILLLMIILPECYQQELTQKKDIECYSCGPEKLCPFPWNPEGVDKVKCLDSCFKFDGKTMDGTRVFIRECGYFKATECTSQQQLFGANSAKGRVCHCKEAHCNSVEKIFSMLLLIVCCLFFLLLV